MKNEFLKKFKEQLEEMKKEGKIEDIKVEEESGYIFDCVDDEDEYEEVQINKPTNRKMKPTTLKKGVIAAATALVLATGFSAVPNTNFTGNQIPYEVEAKSKKKKKDKTKPVIKFSGKSKITAYKNKSIKIPKTTAKDNKDGSVTKKLKVTVKKGKKSYSSIAKKIKSNKSVKFTSTGKYTITYTVTDKAGNKATKKRYITVKTAPKKTAPTTEEKPTPVAPPPAPEKPTQPTTTETPTTQAPTTEKPTTEVPTTEVPTTETPTTEQPTTEEPANKPIIEKPIVGDGNYKIHRVQVGERMYNIVNDPDYISRIEKAPSESNDITLNIENDYSHLLFSKDSGLLENYNYLNFLGELTATDINGKFVSETITIYAPYQENLGDFDNIYMYIYVEDTAGNSLAIPVCLKMYKMPVDYDFKDDSFGLGYHLLSKNPVVYGSFRSDNVTKSLGSAKKLELVK